MCLVPFSCECAACVSPPSVDLTQSVKKRTMQRSNIPSSWIGDGQDTRTRQFETFDAFSDISELTRGHTTHDMFSVDEWRGDKVRSRPCVGQLKAEQQRDDMCAGNT